MPRISWKLGRAAGIDVFLHPSALLLFLLVQRVDRNPLELMVLVAAMLGSITLHEFGHALMARRYGIETEDITLYVIGGVARLRRLPRSPGPELLIALAGPAVNLAIVAGLGAMGLVGSLSGLGSSWLLWNLLVVNLMLGAFNLLPIFPMDGGRVLRALLSGWLGRVRATEIAATVGQVIAVVGGVALMASGWWLTALLAVVVYVVAGIERAQVQAEAGPGGLSDVPRAPIGFRWADRGDGVFRLVPIAMPFSGWRRRWS